MLLSPLDSRTLPSVPSRRHILRQKEPVPLLYKNASSIFDAIITAFPLRLVGGRFRKRWRCCSKRLVRRAHCRLLWCSMMPACHVGTVRNQASAQSANLRGVSVARRCMCGARRILFALRVEKDFSPTLVSLLAHRADRRRIAPRRWQVVQNAKQAPRVFQEAPVAQAVCCLCTDR